MEMTMAAANFDILSSIRFSSVLFSLPLMCAHSVPLATHTLFPLPL